jgi:hypothetical protein
VTIRGKDSAMIRNTETPSGQQGLTAALIFGSVVLLAILGAWQFADEGVAPARPEAGQVVDFAAFRRADPDDIGFREMQCFPSVVTGASGLCAIDSGICVVGSDGAVFLREDGEELGRFAFSGAATCVAAGPDQKIYIGFRDRIAVYLPSGLPAADWSSFGERAVITSVAVVDNGVVVADSGTRTVWRLDKGGRVLGRIGNTENGKGEGALRFIVPSPYFDVADGGDGTFWVANPGEQRLMRLFGAGERLEEWGVGGMGLGAFCGCCNPAHIAVLPDGGLVTSEKGIPRISEYSSAGEYRTLVASAGTFGLSVRPADLAVLKGGHIVVLDTEAQMVRVFERVPSPDSGG